MKINKGNIWKRVKAAFKWLYYKLARINDSPQKVAQGFGLGVFLGIFPGVGPIAAFVLSSVLRMNRASALLGSLVTNTWISIVIFLPAVKMGSVITGVEREAIRRGWSEITTNFNWSDLFKQAFLKVVVPLGIGYAAVSLFIAIFAYATALVIAKNIDKHRKRRNKG